MMKVLESVFKKIGDKLGEKMVNFALGEKDMVTFTSLKENLKRLSAIQFDVDEEIKKAELLGNKKRKREVGEWLEAVQIVENEFRQLENEIPSEGFIQQFFSGGRAAELDARIRELVQQRQYFSEVVVISETKGETLLTCGLVGKEFERNLEKIVKFLLENDGLCIGICGMGGIGKTTLAKHINNKLVKEHSAYCVSWIVVSQEFRVTSLQDNIAKDLGLDLSDERNEDKRASRLHKKLSEGQNRLLIFDDMWEAIDLVKVGIPLVFGKCKLMITTRSHQVCRGMSCKQVVEVKKLDNEEAWNLFSEKLGQGVKLTPEVQEIAKSMVEICAGLPLGIVTLAGSMRGEPSKNVWRYELEKLKESRMEQEHMQEKVFKVLKYSFDRLGERDGNHNGYSKLQKCFLHCSLYPEDHEIKREHLIRLFILEKFLDERKSREKLFVQGHAMLDKLVNACLLEMVGDGVKMHDLVRALALELRKGKTKVLAGQYLNDIPKGEEWTKDLENMSLMGNRIKRIPGRMSPNCSKLKTLLLSSNPWLMFIPESFFLKMCNLCILDLSRTGIEKLPNSLCYMEKLEALLLQSCRNLKSIPNLDKLKKLRELDVEGTSMWKVDHKKAKELNHGSQSLHDMPGSEIVPRSLLLNFQYLHCLHLPYHVEAPIEDIVQLDHLDEFYGRVKDASEFNKLVRKTSLYNIVVSSSDMLYDVCGSSTQGRSFKYIDVKQENISVKQHTQPLQLNTGVGRGKSVVENFAMMNAKDLTVSRCNEIECIWRREQLVTTSIVASTSSSPIPPNSILFSSLMKLYISDCKKMKKMGLKASELPKIEIISIINCEAIEELVEAERGNGGEVIAMSIVSLSQLTRLDIQNCEKMKRLRLTASQLPSIVYIDIKRCGAIEELLEEDSSSEGEVVSLSKLTSLKIQNCEKMKKLRLTALQLPSIEHINIQNCGAIEELLEEDSSSEGKVVSLSKLTRLDIQNCEKMKKLRLTSQLPSIEHINIQNCGAIEELLEEDSSSEGKVVSLSKLTRLDIQNCEKMKKLRLTASQLPSIEHINIQNCGAIEELLKEDSSSEGKVVSLSKLTSLQIQYCKKMKKLRLTASQLPSIERISIWSCGAIEELLEEDSSSEEEVVSLSKLKSLQIQYCMKMKKLRLTASQLPSIERIFIWNCGAIEELLEEDSSSEGEVVSLSKLTSLKIQNCEKMKKLRLLASQLPSIEHINIQNCGGIEELLEEDSSSEGKVVSPSKLTSLDIQNCEKMKKLRLTALQLPSIKKIIIRNCGAIEELLEEDSPSERKVVSLSKLTSLEIKYCKKMKKLRLTASQLPSIEHISIWNCGAIEELLEEDSSSEGEVVFLSKLTSLDIQNSEKMEKLRLTASQLPSIEHINIQNCVAIEELLEEDSSSEGEVVSLSKLTSLKIQYCEKMKKLRLTASQLPSIEHISIWNCGAIEELLEEDSSSEGEVVFLSKLTSLEIKYCKKMKKLRLTTSQLPNIEDISIWSCEAIEELLEEDRSSEREVVSLSKLTSLEIQNCEKMKKLRLTASQLPTIQYIDIGNCGAIEELLEEDSSSEGEVVCLSKLTSLEIKYCKKMKKLRLTASQLPNIEDISIWSCEAIEELLEEDSSSEGEVVSLSKLTSLKIQNCEKMKKFRLIVSQLPSIEHINIQNCGAIEELLEEDSSSEGKVVSLSKLTRLDIQNCEKMKKLRLTASQLPSIEHINIQNYGAIEELLEEDSSSEGKVVSLSKLTRLDIQNCEKMKKLRLTASQLPSIEHIDIGNCGAIEELLEEDSSSEGEVVSLSKLTRLTIGNCEKMKKLRLIVSQLPTIQYIDIGNCGAIEELLEEDSSSEGEVVCLSKLTSLEIKYCKKMKKLRLTTSQLPNIEDISIWSCEAIEELLEEDSSSEGEVVSLSKLTRLFINNCEKMKKVRLTALQLPSIEHIDIQTCGEIEELLEEDSSSEEEVVSLSKLTRLTIGFCEKMKSISSGTTIACPSIRHIRLERCPLLRKLPLIFGVPNHGDPPFPLALPKIYLTSEEKEWWERMELEYPMDHSLLQPFLHFDLILRS